MQSRASDLIKISRIEAEKWLSNGLEKKDAKEIRDLLSVGNENNLIESFHKKDMALYEEALALRLLRL